MTVRQVGRESLADLAAAALLERIRGREWALGEKLPGETTLGPQLGVGRSTVREAIRRLAGRGVVEARQGAGVYVIALDPPEEWDAVVRRATIASVLETRIAIESEAAGLAAGRRTPAELRTLRRALAARDRSDTTVEDYVDTDTAFHRAVVVAAHNEIMIDMFDGFVPRVRRSMIELLRLRPAFDRAADHRPHVDLVTAIADRDAAAASDLSRAHLTSLKEHLG
ncbi:FadR/GntR family transcriptional regulator [Microlunatus speluncae]|uniref:FadR/GntR family transcriptional regulator n=1 Tax=Microlunatus speluncae TaxID=2594267 RepID=UPI0012660CCA|nr:FCD domain-containing protein [Microlunatus speluncae]